MNRVAIVGLGLAAAFFLILLYLATHVAAHEAPAGWSYDATCCNTKDCAPATKAVLAEEGGWRVTETGDLVPYNDRAIRESKDGGFHVCKFNAQTIDGRWVRCLYVPPQGF